MKTVMVFGTFDLLHLGHMHLLQEAKSLGDELIVIISRDDRAKEIKNKNTIHTEEERRSMISHLSFVDKAILGDKHNVYAAIEKYKPAVIALGYDQIAFTDLLEEKLKEMNINSDIVRISAYNPDIYKSSKIIKRIQIKKPTYHVCVPIALIVKDGKLLMSLRNDNENLDLHEKWEFPGGGVEQGETVENCLIREVKEETGFSVEIVERLPYIHTETFVTSKKNKQVFLPAYVCKYIETLQPPSDREVLKMNWFDLKNLFDYPLIGANRDLLEKVLPDLKSIIKTHNL